jgi:hypothetical protein
MRAENRCLVVALGVGAIVGGWLFPGRAAAQEQSLIPKWVKQRC